MTISIKRLEGEFGVVFEDAEIAPDMMQVLHINNQRFLEFFVTRKVVQKRPILYPLKDGPKETIEEHWLIVPGSKFQIVFDPSKPLHDQAYEAISNDPRFKEGDGPALVE